MEKSTAVFSQLLTPQENTVVYLRGRVFIEASADVYIKAMSLVKCIAWIPYIETATCAEGVDLQQSMSRDEESLLLGR